MKWEIESVVDDEGPTMTVRVKLTLPDGSFIIDQRSLPDGSSKEVITAMCEDLCATHNKPVKKDLSSLSGLKGSIKG